MHQTNKKKVKNLVNWSGVLRVPSILYFESIKVRNLFVQIFDINQKEQKGSLELKIIVFQSRTKIFGFRRVIPGHATFCIFACSQLTALIFCSILPQLGWEFRGFPAPLAVLLIIYTLRRCRHRSSNDESFAPIAALTVAPS